MWNFDVVKDNQEYLWEQMEEGFLSETRKSRETNNRYSFRI
jgi:hypothetical protein